LALVTAKRTRRAVVAPKNFNTDYRLPRLSSGRPFYLYPLPSPKGLPYCHPRPRSEVIVRSPLSSREVIIESFSFSLLKGFFELPKFCFEVNEVFPRLLKFFGFAELPKFSKIFGVAEVLLFLPFSPVPLVSPKLPNLPNSACSGPRKIPASVSCNNRHAARTQIDHPPSGVDTSPRVHDQKRERFPTFLIKECNINFHSNLFFF
jgi:hypothetical protein